MTKVDFAFQIGGLTLIMVGLALGLIGYLRLGSASTITGLGDLLNTFFVTLLVAPFLVIWGTMILGIGWIAEASRRDTETLDDKGEKNGKKSP
jgi:uncharacterized membrane protein YidH (DUF202 family)